MARADHFFVWRRHHGVPYQHHAIDLGDGTAVHFTDGSDGAAGPGRTSEGFVVSRTPIEQVTRDGRDRIHIVKHRDPLDDETVVDRAVSQIGRKGYDLIADNCEHFACWCVTGQDQSRQIEIAHERLGAVSVKALASMAARTTSRLAVKRLTRAASPWMILADAAQWATEAGGHHVGLDDPKSRQRAGRAVGGLTTLGVAALMGSIGGPVGVMVVGGIWAAGELAGEASRTAYGVARSSRRPSYDVQTESTR